MMDYVYVFTGMFMSVIALFERDLLIQKRSFRMILGVSITLFLAGLLLHFTSAWDSSCGALLTPLFSVVVFRICRRGFLRRYKQEPKDTWLNWTENMGAHRLFNIVYFGSSLLFELLAMGGMMKLAKVGW